MAVTFAHVNARSFLPNFNSFLSYVEVKQLDIVGVTESWLHGGTDGSDVRIVGYNLVRCDRNNRGGYNKRNIKYTVLIRRSIEYCECIWLKLQFGKDNLLAMCIVYRPPNTDFSVFVDHYEDKLIECSSEFNKVICMGDINVNMFEFESRNTLLLNSAAETFGTKQIINETTHITDASITLIDLIFANAENISDGGVDDAVIADHLLISCKYRQVLNKQPRSPITYRRLSNINYNDDFLTDLTQFYYCCNYS